MICPKCGANLPDDSVFCAQCGYSLNGEAQAGSNTQPPVYGEPQPIPPQYSYNTPQQQENSKPINGTTYLVFAIIATVLCCLPFGIPAIVYATKIDKAQALGDFLGAQSAAKKSKMWSIIAAVSAVVIFIIYIVLMFAFGFSMAESGLTDYNF